MLIGRNSRGLGAPALTCQCIVAPCNCAGQDGQLPPTSTTDQPYNPDTGLVGPATSSIGWNNGPIMTGLQVGGVILALVLISTLGSGK